jgi:acyl-CoA synthetase (AMP-forming)/AMP-acid ligase II
MRSAPARTFAPDSNPPNCLEFVEADVACTRAGILRVGVGDRLSGDECRYILEHRSAAVLITTPELLARLGGDPPASVTTVLTVDGERPGAWTYEAVLRDAAPRLAAPVAAPSTPNYVLYTSGTTGRPKGATSTQGTRVAAMLNMLASELRLAAAPTMVHAGPLTHGSGSKLLAFMAVGATSVILRSFNPEAVAQAVSRDGGTHTFLVPR